MTVRSGRYCWTIVARLSGETRDDLIAFSSDRDSFLLRRRHDWRTNFLPQTWVKCELGFRVSKDLNCQINQVGTQSFKVDGRDFVVEVIDQVEDYLEMMKSIFDFDMIKQYLKTNKILLNSLHGGNHFTS